MIRLLLEAYYEPQFSGRSHGFRPGRGCHTALTEMAITWTGTTWFIEGDISDCFGSLDHEVMISALAEKIHDNRFLRLIKQMLKAGYLEDWEWNATLSGAPQGGVDPQSCPIFTWTGWTNSPRQSSSRNTPGGKPGQGTLTTRTRLGGAAACPQARRPAAVRELRQQLRRLPARDPRDPGYRRLRYLSYADDHSSGSPDPEPKPSRSNPAWPRSCATNSSWNSTRTRP